MRKIDLAQWRTYPGSKVFSGRDRGRLLRKELDVDALDLSDERVEVSIPMDTFGVNQSFFLGLFAKSVGRLGAEGFEAKYKFEGPEAALRTVKEGIEVCQHKGTALDPFLRAG